MRVSFWCAIIGLLAVGTAKAGNLKTVQAGIEWLYSIHGNDIILERVDRIFPSACNGLKLNLIIPEKIDNRTVMGMRARVFDGLRGKPFITYVNIPQSTKFIEGNAAGFSALPHLKFIQVSESNLHFESVGGALYSKGRRSLLKWPSEFQGKAILPLEVESIERSAFDGCNQLEAINIPKKVVGMLPNFSHCTRLKEFVVANDNGRYKSLDGAIYDSAKTILKAWPRGRRGGRV